ncbi:glycosyltransferase [Leuconostoc carnosum]|uniref:glycosyltransferase n=1 Tax=Leuconostoc carnosum TaxID=1252 RepID=UPI00123ADE68|nr:glycosyltransferase [Leuconostoc carnosum]KAA8371471.1 glycosyltransferase [Leuconostoc carnosum]KAA8383192.1 glycosyltransferase [Leuconostoc carnosum]
MIFFVNKGIGHGNSGVEHAQFYRAARFREKNIPFKLIFTDLLPKLHQHIQEWQLAENEVIGLYDYLLHDDPDTYLREGEVNIHSYQQDILLDDTQTQRMIRCQTTGNYQATIYRHKKHVPEKDIYVVEDDRVILENNNHRISWHYRDTASRGRQMTNIHVDNFRGEYYVFNTFETLVAFFFAEIQQRYQKNIYVIDRGTENEVALIQMKRSGQPIVLIDVVHAAHFVRFQNGQPLWNSYYQYMLDHVHDLDVVIVSTQLQKKAMLTHLRHIGINHLDGEIIAIPVGGVTNISAPRRWSGGIAHFVTASRLHSEKNIDHIIQAIHQLRLEGFKSTLDIYGVGSEEQSLINLVNELHLDQVIQFKGLSHQLTDMLAQYDAFVSASYSEGFGLTYLEAMAAALPIATYANLYGAQELIHNGKNGYLANFDPHRDQISDNINHLSTAMRKIFDHYDALSLGAHQLANNYQAEIIATQWQKVVAKYDN